MAGPPALVLRRHHGFEAGATLVRFVHLENDVLTLKTMNFDNGPDGDTFNRLSWTRA